MPTDSRRIAGPESSKNPYAFCTEKPRQKLVLSLLATLAIACTNIDMDAHLRRKSVGIFVNTNDTCITVKPTTELLKEQRLHVIKTAFHCPVDFKDNNLLNKGKRQDGRTEAKIRPIFLKAGVVSQARGSAYIEQNETKVICAVYGPREVVRKEDFSMKGQLTCEFKFATFSCRERRQHQQDMDEKDYSVQLLEALEPAVCLDKFPKAQVNIYVTVLQNDGSALAAAITCASVALADSGIEMYDLVAGCAVRVAGENLLMDPCNQEEYNPEDDTGLTNSGTITVGLMPSRQQVSAITSKGEIEFELVKQAVTKCVEVCTQLYPVLQQVLVRSVSEKLNEDG